MNFVTGETRHANRHNANSEIKLIYPFIFQVTGMLAATVHSSHLLL
jgi:hypothetical protein